MDTLTEMLNNMDYKFVVHYVLPNGNCIVALADDEHEVRTLTDEAPEGAQVVVFPRKV